MATRLEREVERLQGVVNRASKHRVVLHPDPWELWVEADFPQRRVVVRLITDPSGLKLDIPLLELSRERLKADWSAEFEARPA